MGLRDVHRNAFQNHFGVGRAQNYENHCISEGRSVPMVLNLNANPYRQYFAFSLRAIRIHRNFAKKMCLLTSIYGIFKDIVILDLLENMDRPQL